MSQKISDTDLQAKTQQLLQGAPEQDKQGGKTMASLTCRTFFTASPAVGAGLGLVAVTVGAREARAQGPGESAISSNFNGAAIHAGDWIWFTSVLKVQGLGSQAVTIGFMGSITFSVDGTLYVVPVPSALVTFSPTALVATTAFINGQWVTTVPISGLAGNVFLDGFAVQAPNPNGFPGSIKPVTWQGTFFSMTPGITVQWQWAAAVYANSAFGVDVTMLGVKPVDDNHASIYQNSDHAGTPEAFKPDVVGGARGGGGSNFTGSYSGTAAVVPFPGTLMGGS